MGSIRMPLSAIFAAALLLCGNAAWAHKPIFADGAARDAEHAAPVKDVDVSMVTYHLATPQSPQVWLTFEGKKGKKIEFQLGVPRITRLRDLRPSVAVVGPGLPAWQGAFQIPPKLGGVVFESAGGPEPKEFHEPFTGTNSRLFEKQKLSLPESGRYYLVGYLPNQVQGKFWLAVGYKEAYGLGDWLRLPGWIARVRRFHEVGGMPVWTWVLGAVGVAAVAIAW